MRTAVEVLIGTGIHRGETGRLVIGGIVIVMVAVGVVTVVSGEMTAADKDETLVVGGSEIRAEVIGIGETSHMAAGTG